VKALLDSVYINFNGRVSAQMQADAAQKMGGFSKMEGSKSVVYTNKELTHVLGRADWNCHALSLN